MMKAKEVLITGITGTTFMTAFSYAVSLAEKENYSEPERLGQLIHGLLPMLNEEEYKTSGWTLHFAVGLLFAMVYIELWRKKMIKPTLVNNTLIGAASGIIAAGIWKAAFKMHPLPPQLRFNKYYFQLVPAHIVFAVFAGIGYRIINSTDNKHNKT